MEAICHLNPPLQARSRRTLERIVRASLEILEVEGPDALTVQAIVGRAESSVGSFYARFGGKDDLLEYLGERVWREASERWEEALASRRWEELELHELVAGAVRLLSDSRRTRSSYLRAIDRAAGGSGEAYASFRTHLLRGLEELLLGRSAVIEHEEPGVAVPVGLRAVMGVIDAAEAEGTAAVPEDRLIEEATSLLLGYLAPGAARAGGPPGDVEFFDVWG